mgnify:CR=1 FL=1
MADLSRPLRLHAVLWASVGVMVVVAAWGPLGAGWLDRLAIGWEAGVAVFIVATLVRMARAADVDAIRRRAADLDQAGAGILPLSLIAAGASIVVVLGEAVGGDRSPFASGLLALTAVSLSWTFIHLNFALHYAHAFYAPGETKGDRGGLVFPGEDDPDYWDFLHFALIIGVASQTADIQISDRRLRRLSSLHSVTAFVFNTVILAPAVNLVIGLLGRG